MSESARTGSFPAIPAPRMSIQERERESPPPAPPPGPARDQWIVEQLPRALRAAREALDGIVRIEEMLGYSPDPARGIKEGAGLLGQLSTLIEQNAAKERRSSEFRRVIATAAVIVGILGGLVSLWKTVNDLQRPREVVAPAALPSSPGVQR